MAADNVKAALVRKLTVRMIDEMLHEAVVDALAMTAVIGDNSEKGMTLVLDRLVVEVTMMIGGFCDAGYITDRDAYLSGLLLRMKTRLEETDDEDTPADQPSSEAKH